MVCDKCGVYIIGKEHDVAVCNDGRIVHKAILCLRCEEMLASMLSDAWMEFGALNADFLVHA